MPHSDKYFSGSRFALSRDAEILLATAFLCATAVIGFATVSDYGIAVDEWNADDYGHKALAWYASGFSDRAMFTDVEETLWYYGPWFQILIAAVQSLGIAEHWTARHAVTFSAGLAGIAMVVPLARRVVGPWAGVTALTLCLTTGYLYGSLFYSPIDVSFLFSMTAATLAIVVMAGRSVPSWAATISAGTLSGLAVATRSSGVITLVYLIGAMALCGLEAFVECQSYALRKRLAQIGARTGVAVLLAFLSALALWPWLQVGNPFKQFTSAFAYFASHPASWDFVHWGESVSTQHLPWTYVPAQLAARLPEVFLLLLTIGLLAGLSSAFSFVTRVRGASLSRWTALALILAQSRLTLVLWAAVLLPLAFIIVNGSTLYDGVRHVFFLIPLLAVLAGYGFVRLLPLTMRAPTIMAAGVGAYLGYHVYVLAALHPLEYIAFNAAAGGVHGAYGRFDMDYWAQAATVALRRLEDRLNLERPTESAPTLPSLLICIPWREAGVEPMYRRPWRLETDASKADYLIATERMNCAENQPVVLIDEVKRFGRPFAWTYARQPQGTMPSAAPAPR